MVRFECTHCGAAIAAGEEHGGTMRRCPRCHEVVAVPHHEVLGLAAPPPWARHWPLAACGFGGVLSGLVLGVVLGTYFSPAYYDSRYRAAADRAMEEREYTVQLCRQMEADLKKERGLIFKLQERFGLSHAISADETNP